MDIKGLSITNVKIEDVNLEDYSYGLVTEMSQVSLLSGKELTDYVIGKELLEARFFDTEKELHVWREMDKLCAVLVKETEETDPVLKKSFPVTGSVNADGRWINIVQYLTYDEDGQACIGLTRLCDVTGKEE